MPVPASRRTAFQKAKARQAAQAKAALASEETVNVAPKSQSASADDGLRKALLMGADRLSLEEAEELGQWSRRLWVLNNSARPGVRSTDVIFHVTSSSTGEKSAVTVPRTFIPIDLALLENREDLLASRELRGLLDRDVLALIGDTVAQEILGQPDAIQEKARLNEGRASALSTPEEEPTASQEVQALCNNREPWSRKGPALRNLLPSLTADDIAYLLEKIPDTEPRLRAMLQRS